VLTALRFAACAVPLVFVVPRPTARARYVIAYGLVFGVAKFGLLLTAMAGDMPAGMASLVLQAQALFSVLLATTVLGERLRPAQLAGVVLASAGIGALAVGRGGHATMLGFGLTLAAAAAWAVANVVVRASGERRPLSMLAYSSLVPPLPLLALAVVHDGPGPVAHALGHLTGQALLVVGFMAYVSTLLGFGLWNRLLARYPVARVAPFSLLVPVVGIAAAAVVLHEPVTWRTVGVAVAVLVGLALVVGVRSGDRDRPSSTTVTATVRADDMAAPAGLPAA
jgi:O-acetylserine/cysteine efflux transporter